MIAIREKLVAFGIHFAVTLLLALAAAALIFLVWFPDPFQTMVGGSALFILVVGCDLTLGPLLSLVIYNSKKSRRELLIDYSIVGAVQLAALIYGVFVVSGARPVYVAFVKDRLEVIQAAELADADVQAATDPQYRSKSLWGTQLVGVTVPPKDRKGAFFTALAGKDIGLQPKYYASYESQIAEVKTRAKPLAELAMSHKEAEPLLAAASKEIGRPEDQLRWLPVKHSKGFWTALIDADSGRPVGYLPIDPY